MADIKDITDETILLAKQCTLKDMQIYLLKEEAKIEKELKEIKKKRTELKQNGHK